ncbi:branched-chain amino acid ABC transporter substrate-binding protein [Cellulomonas sp. JH27-2]|uniref:branched-chain amino acid ABC transporter substrate-binding protein n=1 Tax=Cellulomonas sp. JH27-2 TaxID=2774139 RepID=UPI00177D62C2|nr:branched-chain amino acid ABC transporter substrate-binding protein [Cellulomonas sp. JH27-2]MBD8058240.1 branched-chain amino acid ABC transporter substrate-binding protein [Cellulomonas sp. JH27-2]
MRRSTPQLAGTALVLAVGLVLTGCSSKDDSGDTTSPTGGSSSAAASGDLSIQPLVQIDNKGAEVPAADSSNAADPAGDGSAKCDPTTIAMAGALTGANAALGINILNGAKLAVDAHNAANKDCQVTIKQFDTEGDPQKATQVAPQIAGDKSIIGLLGPAFSGETKAVGPVFQQAGLLSLTASATNPDLTKNGWTNFFRGLANDAVQGPSVAAYMVNTLNFKKVCVVQDDSDYGVGLAEQITAGLGSAADSACAAKVKTGDKDFSATVQIVKGESPDAVFYAGYYAEGAPFASQLKEGGVTAAFVSADGTNDPEFVKQAGSAAKGAYLSCPCGPAPEKFAADYQAKFSVASGVYSVEAYDLATIMLKGIDSGVKDRAGMVDFVKNYDGDGLARHYKWDANGELASALIWIYQVK